MLEEKYLQEIAPYRKKGPRNKRTTNKKHKHNYVPINISNKGYSYLTIKTKCTICEHEDFDFFRINPQMFDEDDYLNSIQKNVEFFNKLKKERRKQK